MNAEFDLKEIAETVEASGALFSVLVSDIGEHPAVLGSTRIGGRSVSLTIELRAPFPAARPVVLLNDPAQYGLLPHLDAKGELCYSNGEGILLDWRRPSDLVVECIGRALAVLERGLGGDIWDEYLEEYEAHWRQPIAATVLSVLDPGNCIEEIKVFELGETLLLARDASDVDAFYNGKPPKATTRTGLLIPIDEPRAVVPVPDTDSLIPLRHAIFTGLSARHAVTLRRLLKHRKKTTDHVVLQVDRPSGESALVGLLFKGIGATHPLLEGGEADAVERIVLVRRDRSYLLPRGGASLTQVDRRVCVVGCGAVGSRIVDELAHTGVSSLLLIDPDALSSDNAFRHLLGRQYWGKGKAEALAEWVTSNVPYVRVDAHRARFDEVLIKVPPDKLAEIDLVIFATGNETTDLHANAVLHARQGLSMLFTWLEPLGIGGHALLELPDAPGCLECLHTGEGGKFVENRAAFSASGQSFVRDLSGCGSPFTPFSNLHATQTAVLATRLALDYLSGFVTRPCLRSWRGDPREFLSAGLRLSARYGSSTMASEDAFAALACRVCGSAVAND